MTPRLRAEKAPLVTTMESKSVHNDDVSPITIDPSPGGKSDTLDETVVSDTAHDDAYYCYDPDIHYYDHDVNDDDDDDDETASETSTFSTVSRDSLPPISAYGHTYHASRRLFSPNDASEARRQELQHALYKLCLDGGLTAAKLPLDDLPPHEPYHILDIGSGSGLWAMEMAQTYPSVNIIGTDLSSALLPSDVPPNLTFEIADAADSWPPCRYDFIHMRNLVGGGIRDWNQLLRDAYAHLKPGGQLEFTEVRPRFFDVDPEQADLPDLAAGEKPEIGASCLEYEITYAGMCARMELDFDPIPRIADFLSSSLGAESVRERVDWLPVKSWGNDPIARRKGEIVMEMIDYLENWTLMLFGVCGWEEADTRALLERVKKEVRDPKLRSYTKVTFITARKPCDEK